MKPLIQLDNGDWVDPEAIRSILTFRKTDRGNSDRVAIHLDHAQSNCDFESFEDAERYRDELAAIVNRSDPRPILGSEAVERDAWSAEAVRMLRERNALLDWACKRFGFACGHDVMIAAGLAAAPASEGEARL